MGLDPKGKRARIGAQVKFYLLIALLGAVVATGVVYSRRVPPGDPGPYLILLPVVIIALLMVPLLRRLRESVKFGLPVEDERSRAIGDRAGALTFYVSIYVWLAIGMFGDRELDASAASGIAIMASALLYLGLRVFLESRKD